MRRKATPRPYWNRYPRPEAPHHVTERCQSTQRLGATTPGDPARTPGRRQSSRGFLVTSCGSLISVPSSASGDGRATGLTRPASFLNPPPSPRAPATALPGALVLTGPAASTLPGTRCGLRPASTRQDLSLLCRFRHPSPWPTVRTLSSPRTKT